MSACDMFEMNMIEYIQFSEMLDHYKALLSAEMAAEKVVAKSQTFLPVRLRLKKIRWDKPRSGYGTTLLGVHIP